LSLDEQRALYDGLGATFPTPDDVILERLDAAGVPAEWCDPPGAAEDRAILYVHGGGYVIGSIASHRHLVAALARAAGARALSLNYRLAPEHPFPAAVEDALAGYRFLLASGFAPGKIAVAGDSAGGGLTVATLLAAREAGLPQPACGFCISPWVDLEGLGASMTSKAGVDPMVQKQGLGGMAGAYLAGASPRTPLAAPLHADLAGLAPLLIQVGSAETLLDDATRLAAVAAAADVDVRLESWPGMIHVWPFFHTMLSEGREAIAVAGAYIRARMDLAQDLSAAA
ncbi:MAG TPA: alpha/beta hydrolase, partial [Caulobacteraceae bacterium]